ncbi:MAG: YbjN domain-containing protein [Hyphomonas sp.]|tara:strand:+ start:1716 stop:2219 length:504 start_codon:yes stop_codon:yes gene_type:complete
MSLDLSRAEIDLPDPLERVEEALETAGWQYDRDEDGTIQAVAETKWGDMGALFAYRPDPSAIHYSMTLDVKPVPARRAAIAELIMMANERLWLGHFDYWADEGVIIFRYTFSMLDRDEVSPGEARAAIAASISAADRFVPAFNFLIWAGKSPRESIEAVMFETHGEA